MMYRMKLLALALTLGAAQHASASNSVYFEISGNSCHSTMSGLQAVQTRFGLYNPSSTSGVDVACPVQVPYGSYTYGYLGISGYHRNPNDGLSCTLNLSSDDGYYWSTAVATISNTGSGVLYGSRYTFPAVGSPVVWLGCHIPASYAGSYSYLNSVLVNVSY